jgi:hypothetical protein
LTGSPGLPPRLLPLFIAVFGGYWLRRHVPTVCSSSVPARSGSTTARKPTAKNASRAVTDPPIPDPWRPRKDLPTYVISTVVLVLEPSLLGVLVLAALVTRAAAAAAGLPGFARSEKIGT